MVRLLFMPKSPERQFTKKVYQLNLADKRILADVLEVPQYHNVQVALCVDGNTQLTSLSVATGLQEIYAALGRRANVSVRIFSFLDHDTNSQKAILDNADLFFFGGVHEVSDRLKLALSATTNENDPNDLRAHLRRRVHYDNMPYIGVCGGASMASSPETCVYGCGLDLLHGRQIEYLSTVGLRTEVEPVSPRVPL